MDKGLKAAAMKKAKAQGLTLSAMLNIATESFVKGRFEISAFDRDVLIANEQIRRGQVISQEALFKKLGL